MIQNILLRVTIHSTEKIYRIKKAIGFFLLSDIIDIKEFFDSSNKKLECHIDKIDYEEIIDKALKNKIELMSMAGHYNNPITIISAKITRKFEISSFFKHIRKNISFSEQEKLVSDIPNRLDENQVLHLRFNKQAAFLGKIFLTKDSDAISVKIKIVTYPKNRNSAIIEAGELFDRKFL